MATKFRNAPVELVAPAIYLLFVFAWYLQDKIGQLLSLALPWNACRGDAWFQLCVTPALSVVILFTFPGIVLWAWMSFFLNILFPKLVTDSVIASLLPMVVLSAAFYFVVAKTISKIVGKFRHTR